MQSQHPGLPNEYLILTDRVKYFEFAKKHNAKEDRIAELETFLNSKQDQIAKLETDLYSKQLELQREKEDNSALQQSRKFLNDQNNNLQKANHTLQLQVDKLLDTITELQNEAKELKLRSLDAASPEYKQMQEKYSTMQQEYSAMEKTTKQLQFDNQVTKVQMDTLLKENLQHKETNSALQKTRCNASQLPKILDISRRRKL